MRGTGYGYNETTQTSLTEADPVFAFNKAIIDATQEYTVAYKINTAFYEAQGLKGWESMEKTRACILKISYHSRRQNVVI